MDDGLLVDAVVKGALIELFKSQVTFGGKGKDDVLDFETALLAACSFCSDDVIIKGFLHKVSVSDNTTVIPLPPLCSTHHPSLVKDRSRGPETAHS